MSVLFTEIQTVYLGDQAVEARHWIAVGIEEGKHYLDRC